MEDFFCQSVEGNGEKEKPKAVGGFFNHETLLLQERQKICPCITLAGMDGNVVGAAQQFEGDQVEDKKPPRFEGLVKPGNNPGCA